MLQPELILRHDIWAQANGFGVARDKWAAGHQRQPWRAISEIENMGFAGEYAELGYTQPKRGILFANWNYFSHEAWDMLQRMGFECEWSDEWTTCEDCGKAVRTTADSYGWQPSYFMPDDCTILCRDCCDIPAYLESIEDNPRKAVNDHISPADYGYVKLEGNFENGFHPGQNDNPREIYKRVHAAGYKHLLFCIDSVGQFDIQFSIWTRSDKEGE
jgi:hypothetical protein